MFNKKKYLMEKNTTKKESICKNLQNFILTQLIKPITGSSSFKVSNKLQISQITENLYKASKNYLSIKLPIIIDKTTLLNIFMFYGDIDHININENTNTILLEYFKITSAMKCFSEISANFQKLSKIENLEISFIEQKFKEKFYLGIEIQGKLSRVQVKTNCLIQILSNAGLILEIYQKISYCSNDYKQEDIIKMDTIIIFNDSRDKEKADFILRRIISPYFSFNSPLINSANEIKNEIRNNKDENKEEELIIDFSNNFDIYNEPEINLISYRLIYQHIKTVDDENYDNYFKNDNEDSKIEKFYNNGDLIFNDNDNQENNVNTNTEISKIQYTGIKQRNTPIEERKKYVIVLENIINETDQRTTLMIKNIPRNISQGYLMELINYKFRGLFNFFYLPIDFQKNENAGYAFINFKSPKNIVDFFIEYNDKPWIFYKKKKGFVSYARIQGFRAITQHFSISNIMQVNDEDFKPFISAD